MLDLCILEGVLHACFRLRNQCSLKADLQWERALEAILRSILLRTMN